MSRSLFARLNARYGHKVDPLTRRDFVKASVAASATLLLSRYSFGDTPARSVKKRIVVIGAGFSGLACAHELLAAGYDVTVIEARDRVGGRVLSLRDFVPGKNVEGGGELLGSNHLNWMSYAQKFGLEFIDVTESEDECPITLGGKRLSAEEQEKVWEEMDAAFNVMNEDAKTVNAEQPWASADAAALDKKSVKEWLDAQKELSDLTRMACDVQLSSDNGQACANQSYLGLLASVAGGGGETYWTESEVYRCKGGNQQLAFKLVEAIGPQKVILGLPVTDVRVTNTGVTITCKDGRTIECDEVIVTVPPTVWSRINFTPGFPKQLYPQMGHNLKWLGHIKTRFWKDAKLAPDSLSDGMISQTWEGTDAQEGDDGACLNCFSGGDPVKTAMEFTRGADADGKYLDELAKVYTNIKENYVNSRFMNWPKDPWTQTGYSFPAPGQVTTVGPALWKGIGPIHFAGEHCSYQFVGYMEGGLSSGVLLARRLAMRDGLIKPATQPATMPTSAPAMAK